MHGVVFASFREFLCAAYGVERMEELLASEPIYLLSEAYDDDRFAALVERTAAASEEPVDDLLRAFGAFTGERTFPQMYPAFYAVAPDTREFVLTVEQRIHELVRATIPNARPPQLNVSPLEPDGVSIVYCSPRRLCALLYGLVEGTARRYGETAAGEEVTCMLRGDAVCTLAFRFAPAINGEPHASARARPRSFV